MIANSATLEDALGQIPWDPADEDVYSRTVSAIQNVSTLRRSRRARVVDDPHSRGARLKSIEDSISTLDNLQSKAVIETVAGVQRIRGLAGSGKTIVLALKAAYLHAQHPEWRIAVTFNTRSLKAQFRRLITNFFIEQTGEEPDWENVKIVNSWGAPGGVSREGLYYQFCLANGVEYYGFGRAKNKFGRDEVFALACETALGEAKGCAALYDVILVDEAQDLPPSFLRLCYSMLSDNRRLVYAYDELQNLSGTGLPSEEEIFGSDSGGKPLVTFDGAGESGAARRDIVLEKCYRNSRPILVAAHGLGFGIHHSPTRNNPVGLVQMFHQPSLWTDIGYQVVEGALDPGSVVKLGNHLRPVRCFLRPIQQ